MPDLIKQWDFSSRIGRRRRSLVPLAGLLGVVLVSTTLLGTFGLHFSHKGFEAIMIETKVLIGQLDTVRLAQVHFKKQVQEWKNVLLRGHERDQFKRYFDLFNQEATAVRALLGELAAADQNTALAGRIKELLQEHVRLDKTYHAALADHEPGLGFDPRVVDALVRGIDRDLDKKLDTLADVIEERVMSMHKDAERRLQERYRMLQRVATIGLALSVLLVGIFLFLAMRSERSLATRT